MASEEPLSKKSSLTEVFSSSFNSSNKKVFVLFLCDINYKKKDIDILTNKICDVLNENAFEKQDLKKETTRRINFLYEQYQNFEQNSGRYIQLNDININKNELKKRNSSNDIIINDNFNNINNINSLVNDNIINTNTNTNTITNNLDDSTRRSSSRIIWSKINKTKTNISSIDINDLTTIKENDSDLSIIFKQSLDENLNFSQMKKMKSIKKINIILCSVLFLISLVLIILLLYNYS